MRIAMGSLVLLVFLIGTAQAVPTYSGSLSYGDGITGISGNPWLATGTVFSWDVEANLDETFTYTYRLQVPDDSKEISHLIIEVSPSFTEENILDVLTGSLSDDQPDDYPKASDVGMPSPMFGVKFEGGDGDSYDWTVSFVSDRAPVWGDFYAVDGKKPGEEVAIWNAGFGNPDSDPTNPPANGSIGYHILVPDTTTTTVPAPGAVLLSSLGIGLVGWLRRRDLV